MKMSMLFNFILLIIIECTDGNTARVLSNEQTHDNGFVLSQKFYRKFQEPTVFTIGAASDVYQKVTGFTAAFFHTEPLLYKIKFDAIFYNQKGAAWVFPRIMVNDYLMYNDKLIQNTVDRYKFIPGYTDVHNFDLLGVGQYYFPAPVATAITKSELIYLQPGLHVIDVAARAIGNIPVTIYNGVLTIELVHFRKGANIGQMPPINATFSHATG